MKVVLDTNIIISAFFWGGELRKVLERCIDGRDELFTSKEILDEVRNVLLRPKFNADPVKVIFFVKALEDIALPMILEYPIPKISHDPEDDKFLACALMAQADYIISGDNDLLSLVVYENIPILTAREYLGIVDSL